jgi:hypothetical protein
MSDPEDPLDPQSLLRRIEQLERDNERLRERIDPNLGPDNPNFHPKEFLKVLQRTIALITVPPWLLFGIAVGLAFALGISRLRIGPIPVIDIGGMTSGMYGQGFGIISCGGIAFGGIAMGGGAIGLVAMGGVAVGVVAIGGGSVGVIAVGGGHAATSRWAGAQPDTSPWDKRPAENTRWASIDRIRRRSISSCATSPACAAL